MSDDGRYRIVDEPEPGALARFAVDPMYPFFAFMIFWWIGAPWFLLNALALRGGRLKTELLLLALAVLARWGLIYVIAVASAFFVEDLKSFLTDYGHYLTFIPLAVSLWFAYYVFAWQSATHEIRSYLTAVTGRS